MIRRLSCVLALALLPSLASAQGFIRYYAPAGTTFTGGAVTTPILAPAANNCASVPYSFSGDPNTGVCSSAADTVVLLAGGVSRLTVTDTTRFNGDFGLYGDTSQTYFVSGATGYKPISFASWSTPFVLAGSMPITWTSDATNATGGTYDVLLYRDAANTLALRNGTGATPQTFNWYYQRTDASNYHRGALKTSSTGVEIAAETAGTGADNLNVTLTPAGTGKVVLGGTASPAATDACTAGSATWDASYIYICTATGVWKRAALTGGY